MNKKCKIIDFIKSIAEVIYVMGQGLITVGIQVNLFFGEILIPSLQRTLADATIKCLHVTLIANCIYLFCDVLGLRNHSEYIPQKTD